MVTFSAAPAVFARPQPRLGVTRADQRRAEASWRYLLGEWGERRVLWLLRPLRSVYVAAS